MPLLAHFRKSFSPKSNVCLGLAAIVAPLCMGNALASGTPASTQAKAPSTEIVKRGDALSKSPAKSVDECIRESSKINGKTVKISGKVKQVCQTKGCWFTLVGDKGDTVRITSLGYKFFVPTNADGRYATVEGIFGVKELSAEMAQHYEDDRVAGTNEAPKKITTATKEFSLAATAVELK